MLFDSKRSESDILFEILSHANGGIRKTRLLHKANMSHNQLNRYITILKYYDIMKEKRVGDDGKLYIITEKGKVLLNCLQEMHNLFDDHEMILSNVF